MAQRFLCQILKRPDQYLIKFPPSLGAGKSKGFGSEEENLRVGEEKRKGREKKGKKKEREEKRKGRKKKGKKK